jgi:Protein tyrosine and serine/threonine kinase
MLNPPCDSPPSWSCREIASLKQSVPWLQETQYHRTQSKASDVYVLGVILWELYHSRPCSIPTRTTFYILNPTFPRFPETCPLPYAALTVACVQTDPKKRCGAWDLAAAWWPAQACAAPLLDQLRCLTSPHAGRFAGRQWMRWSR